MEISDGTFQMQAQSLGVGKAIGRLFLRQLSDFVWEKYDDRLVDEPADVPKITKELKDYGITDMTFDLETNQLIITSKRPGILIGVRGSNIKAIEDNFRIFAEKYGIVFEGIKLLEDFFPFDDDLMYSIRLYMGEY
jgi:hypothetical protein